MSSSKENTTYQKIVQRAKSLFQKYGIRKVSVQEICNEAEVSKMTFYRSFKNKEAIAVLALNEISDENMDAYRTIMKQDIAFADRIEEMLTWKQEASNAFSEEFVKDVLDLKDSKLKALFEKIQKLHTTEILNDLKAAQKEGAIRNDVNLNLVLYMLNDIHVKMKDEGFLAMFSDSKEAGMALARIMFNGILSNDNQK